jgi:hypothetical protein
MPVTDPKTVKNRVHLDLTTVDNRFVPLRISLQTSAHH